MELASAEPVIVGVESLVEEPELGEAITGLTGAVVSIVRVIASEAALTFAATSVAVAVMV